MTELKDVCSAPKTHTWFSIKEAAEYLDIGEPTLYRWMRRPEFRRVMDGAVNSFHESCRPETAAARLQAFRTLVDMAIYCKPDERVRAANSLLAYLDRHETSPERRQKWRRPKKSRT